MLIEPHERMRERSSTICVVDKGSRKNKFAVMAHIFGLPHVGASASWRTVPTGGEP